MQACHRMSIILMAGVAIASAATLGHAASLSATIGLKVAPPIVEKVHKQMHSKCYLHAKWPEMACHKHIYSNATKKWVVQDCRPEDCEGMTVRGQKQKVISPE